MIRRWVCSSVGECIICAFGYVMIICVLLELVVVCFLTGSALAYFRVPLLIDIKYINYFGRHPTRWSVVPKMTKEQKMTNSLDHNRITIKRKKKPT